MLESMSSAMKDPTSKTRFLVVPFHPISVTKYNAINPVKNRKWYIQIILKVQRENIGDTNNSGDLCCLTIGQTLFKYFTFINSLNLHHQLIYYTLILSFTFFRWGIKAQEVYMTCPSRTVCKN